MSNNTDLPYGWSMPDDLSKKVSETLNKKPISPEEELADALAEMARDIALIEPEPEDWGRRVIYLLEKVEEEAERRGREEVYLLF